MPAAAVDAAYERLPCLPCLQDLDGDGVADLVHEDVDGDGVYDLIHEDIDGDGVLDVAHEDTDGDGTEDLLHDLRTGKTLERGQIPQEQMLIRRRAAKASAVSREHVKRAEARAAAVRLVGSPAARL